MSEEDINFLISIQDLEQPEFDNACLERENERLKNQLEKYQKALDKTTSEKMDLENIIKEVREYILTHKLYCFEYDEEELFEITTDKKAKDELLEILDKVD